MQGAELPRAVAAARWTASSRGLAADEALLQNAGTLTLLRDTLGSLRRATGGRGSAEPTLHGEPHPGNVLATHDAPLLIDLETCCRGPVEADLAQAPEAVSEHYTGVDHDLLRDCRILVLALVTTRRWDRDDQFPNGHQLGLEWLDEVRAALGSGGRG